MGSRTTGGLRGEERECATSVGGLSLAKPALRVARVGT